MSLFVKSEVIVARNSIENCLEVYTLSV
jgi:hypothetical protein